MSVLLPASPPADPPREGRVKLRSRQNDDSGHIKVVRGGLGFKTTKALGSARFPTAHRKACREWLFDESRGGKGANGTG